MRSFITFVLMTAGILFLSGMMANKFPSVRAPAFSIPANGTTYPISYWLCFLIAMIVVAVWANRKKGRR